MKMKKVWALLVSLMLVASMALPVALAVSDDQGASAAAVSSEEGTPPAEEQVEQKEADPKPDAEPEQDDQESDGQEQDSKESGENQCTCGAAEGEAHAADCPLYEKPEADKADENAALYQKFLAAKTMEEANALYNGLSKEEVTAFRTWLEENNKLTALEQHLSAITPEGEPVTMPIVSFTKVGPLLAAPARRARMMRAAADQDDTGIVLNKSAKSLGNDSYQITLEAYATGASSTTISTEPADIVLVLDVSGSMDDPMTQYNKVYSLNKWETYYIQRRGSYRAVRWNDYDDYEGSWGYWSYGSWTQFEPKTSASDTNANRVQFYELASSYEKKIASLKNAVNNFIDSVAAKSPESQIALVKFAGDKSNRIGNDTYKEGYYTYNNSQIVTELTDASKSASLKEAVNKLQPAGATRADYGMELAKGIISNSEVANNGRKKTVIMFTDGVPTEVDQFNENVANSAISASQAMKAADTTVYTIGVFSGADGTPGKNWDVTPTTGVDRTNKYMHLVSSNYKNATEMGNPDTPTYPDGGKSYFLSAGSAGELSSIFQQISQEVGGSTSKLDEKATIKDIVTPYFNMPTDPKEVKVYTADSDGVESDGSTVKWMGKEPFDGTVSIQNNTVSVSGFSYKDNWCGNQTAGGTTTFRNGKKLIIQFNVTAKDGFLGGNDVPTNDENASGIYDKDDTLVKLFERPTVNVPIKEVKVTAEDKNVYLLGDVTTDQLKTGATVNCGSVELKLGEPNYGLENWQYDYVNLNTEVKDAKGNALTNGYTGLTEDTTYTVSAKVSPKSAGTTTPEKGNAATEQTGQATGKINVFTPELTFKDGNAYYGENVSTDFTANKVEDTVWKHGDTASTDVTMLGTEPTLDIAYALDTDKVENGKYTKEEAAVKATVKIGDTNVTQYTTFQHQDCNPACDWENPAKKGDPAFLIHIKTCTLTIKKTGGAANEPYVFNILKNNEKYSEVTIRGNGNETLYELPVGTYTIQEDTGWSWRFTPKYSEKEVKLSANANTGTITCTNKKDKDKDKWINGFSTVVQNIFGVATD